MQILLRNGVVQLAEGKPLAFRGAHGIHIECTEGMVWLTIKGQPGDFLLAKEERLRIESNGLALVQGLPSGTIRLVSEPRCQIRWKNRFYQSFNQLVTLRQGALSTLEGESKPILVTADEAIAKSCRG